MYIDPKDTSLAPLEFDSEQAPQEQDDQSVIAELDELAFVNRLGDWMDHLARRGSFVEAADALLDQDEWSDDPETYAFLKERLLDDAPAMPGLETVDQFREQAFAPLERTEAEQEEEQVAMALERRALEDCAASPHAIEELAERDWITTDLINQLETDIRSDYGKALDRDGSPEAWEETVDRETYLEYCRLRSEQGQLRTWLKMMLERQAFRMTYESLDPEHRNQDQKAVRAMLSKGWKRRKSIDRQFRAIARNSGQELVDLREKIAPYIREENRRALRDSLQARPQSRQDRDASTPRQQRDDPPTRGRRR